MITVKKLALSAIIASFGATAGFSENPSTNTETPSQYDDVKWERGWIAQSFRADFGSDMPQPSDQPIDRWLDDGYGMFSADYLLAHESKYTQLFKAGTLRSGSVKFNLEGNYVLRSFMDRFISFGQPDCRVRVALDGVTIVDQWGQFNDMGTGQDNRPIGAIVKWEADSVWKNGFYNAQRYRATHGYQSVPFFIPEPGKYRFDIWTFCKDASEHAEIFKLANTYGVRGIKVGAFGGVTYPKVKTNFAGDMVLIDAIRRRNEMNELKTLILLNHGTTFDFTLERLETGQINRIVGDMIYHNAAYTPEKSFEMQTLKPKDQTALASDWLMTAYRDGLEPVKKRMATDTPQFADFIKSVSFVPEKMLAQRILSLPETGKYGFEFQYNPAKEDNQSYERDASEHIQMRMYRLGSSDTGGIQILDRVFKGANDVGESVFHWFNLPAGDYVISTTQDPKMITRNRYGVADNVDPWFNSDIHLSIKMPSSESFNLVY